MTPYAGGRLLRGPNVHHRATVFVALVEPALLAHVQHQDVGADFATRFVERFPGSSVSAEGTLLDALLEAILAVERLVAAEMGRPDDPRFARVVNTPRGEELVWESWAGWISRAAVRVALRGLLELLPGRLDGVARRSQGFHALLARLIRKARRRQWTPAAEAVVRAATGRRLAHELLAGSYVRLGEGVCQQVVAASSMEDEGPESLLERLFPPSARATIPVVLVVGERGATFVARALDRSLRASHRGVGLAVRERLTIQGRPVDPTSIGRRKGAGILLGDPRVETIVGAVSPRSVLGHGLGLERADVAVLVDPSPEGDRSRYEAALGVVLAADPVAVVIGAHNPFAEQLIRSSVVKRIVIVAPRAADESVKGHADGGGLVVQPADDSRGRRVELRKGPELVGSMPLAWPRPGSPAQPTPKQRARALLASGGVFAVRLMNATAIAPNGARHTDLRPTSSTRR